MGFREVGLSESEYSRVTELLGREPNDLELELIGVMWSEHCSYKSTRPLLRTYPSKGRYVLQGQGENAGVVDMGEGWGFAFKVESHNHPSAVAPFQGAATGVGGIIRDIIAMGSAPLGFYGRAVLWRPGPFKNTESCKRHRRRHRGLRQCCGSADRRRENLLFAKL